MKAIKKLERKIDVATFRDVLSYFRSFGIDTIWINFTGDDCNFCEVVGEDAALGMLCAFDTFKGPEFKKNIRISLHKIYAFVNNCSGDNIDIQETEKHHIFKHKKSECKFIIGDENEIGMPDWVDRIDQYDEVGEFEHARIFCAASRQIRTIASNAGQPGLKSFRFFKGKEDEDLAEISCTDGKRLIRIQMNKEVSEKINECEIVFPDKILDALYRAERSDEPLVITKDEAGHFVIETYDTGIRICIHGSKIDYKYPDMTSLFNSKEEFACEISIEEMARVVKLYNDMCKGSDGTFITFIFKDDSIESENIGLEEIRRGVSSEFYKLIEPKKLKTPRKVILYSDNILLAINLMKNVEIKAEILKLSINEKNLNIFKGINKEAETTYIIAPYME